MRKKIQLLIVAGAIIIDSFSQDTGRMFIRNYSSPEYRGSQQNWSLSQDSRGIMYFSNNDGMLSYDGVEWRLKRLPIVRTHAIDSSGRIYVGLENDLGYLQPDKTGSFDYHSLKEQIPESHRDLVTALYAYILGDQVIFLADDKIFILQDEKIRVLTSPQGYHMIFSVRDRLYARERGKGLLYLSGDSLHFIEGSERFADERVYVMLPYRQDEILIGSRTKGVFVYSPEDGTFIKPEGFEEVDSFLGANPIYCGALLDSSNFALGTLTGGIIVFNEGGNIKGRFNKNTGLQDNTVYWLYTDRSGGLWAALDNGISMIPVNLPFRIYSEPEGLNGSPMCLEFYENRCYVGTSQYLHIQNSNGKFMPIEGTEGQNFRLLAVDGNLLLACYQGVFDIKKDKAVTISGDVTGLSFCSLKNHPGFLLAGTADEGFYLLHKDDKSWNLKYHIRGFDKSVYEAVEDNDGNIWISTLLDLYKARINEKLDSIIYLKRYTSSDGLPTNYAMPYKLNSGELVFGTEKGVYRYNETKDLFEPDLLFPMLTGKIFPFIHFDSGEIWFEEHMENGSYEKGFLRKEAGQYVQSRTPFYKFTDLRCYESPFTIRQGPGNSVFICTSSGLLRYDPSIIPDSDQPFRTMIRNVYSRGELIYGGENTKETIEIPFRNNDLVFEYAALFYEDPEKNLYSYRLIGADTTWSAWGKDHKKEYTNLREGRYTFEVRSMNQYRKVGATDSYPFHILVPVYRSPWAYAGYLVLAALIIFLIVKVNIRRLLKQKDHLEKIVSERTAQVMEQKKEIQVKNEELGKALETVNLQKAQIEVAHTNIKESIIYAQKIQQAVMPSAALLSEALPEHFVLFRPCDMVSGDFYWVKKVNQYTIVATADCTGHGIPGAFMSMLGIGLLNEIVTDSDVNEAGEVLNRLRMEIKKSLKQEGRSLEQKDGMDLALYVLEKDKMELQYSGAYNPLYLIRSGEKPDNAGTQDYRTVERNDHTLLEIRANWQPIGIFDEEQPFTTHFVKLTKDDVIYTFSDGFIDQKGGPENKKFMSKAFKELLLDIHCLPMPEQQRVLDRTIEKWKGGNEQTDDILVIGVRI